MFLHSIEFSEKEISFPTAKEFRSFPAAVILIPPD